MEEGFLEVAVMVGYFLDNMVFEVGFDYDKGFF